MSKTARILVDGNPTGLQVRLGSILDFFAVPWETVDVSNLSELQQSEQQVVFGLAETVATALKQTPSCSFPKFGAFYVYAGDDRNVSERALRSLYGEAHLSLREAPTDNISLRVSREDADLTGPMAGLEISSKMRREDAVVVGGGRSRYDTLISAGTDSVFIRFQQRSVPVFFCASSHMVDLDCAIGAGFYDIKDHFCSVVPLVMFLRLMFRDVAWRPQELGACLIIDDPLLRRRYGACDFGILRDLMLRHEFTTNIGFIPWNWRRTTSAAGEFFRNESERYSISVHGCDHIGAEFGATSLEVLNSKAQLAQTRMRKHEARTGIHHDPVMIFPQGVFSSVCPGVLKRNGFLAAANTETSPVDSASARTKIRDVWDVAIMTYSGFPIFTRRYAFHGLENFAFDLLLGKPCLIVAHHDFFKDGGAELIELIDNLRSLNSNLQWRPLGEVIRRACRRRVSGEGGEDVEMYGNELEVGNPSEQAIQVRVRKRESDADAVAQVVWDGKPVAWTRATDHIVFDDQIPPGTESRCRVIYREQAGTARAKRSLRFELSVVARRMLSEFRDDFLSQSRFLSSTASSFKNALTRTN